MPIEQILLWVAGIIGTLLGGGGIWAGVTALSNRKIGIKTTENEANKNISTTWDSIVENLQSQLNYLSGEISELKRGQKELQEQLGAKERLLLKAIGHIIRLELLVPPNPVPPRPEGLE